ncbi:MAG: LysM peptidoglycan-binding domain-containing protein [Chloroflexota bacterium]|nr:LysM peptidoglycan-binding domain-containing protein [Chloroflexota bacterium]
MQRYVVQGQSLADVAQGFGNVTAQSLAAANGISDPNTVVAIGTQLKLPEDAYGTAPPDSRNPGTACVKYAVPNSVFETLPGVGTPQAAPEPPAEFSTNVEVHATNKTPGYEWTVIADGQEQTPNEGKVKIRPGTEVRFVNEAGLHTVTVNGNKVAADIAAPGDTRTYVFENTGDFKLTCDYHPAMLAWIFVRSE